MKRLIGLPGDHVRIARRDGSVDVNGRRLSEPYTIPAPRGLPASKLDGAGGRVLLPGR